MAEARSTNGRIPKVKTKLSKEKRGEAAKVLRPVRTSGHIGGAKIHSAKLSRMTDEERRAEIESVVREHGAAPQKAANGGLSQAEKFEKAARDLECDPDGEKFMSVLRKLAKSKARS